MRAGLLRTVGLAGVDTAECLCEPVCEIAGRSGMEVSLGRGQARVVAMQTGLEAAGERLNLFR
jgi:hypothetical protein